MPESSMVVKLQDHLSAGLKVLAGNVKAFDKDLDDLAAGMEVCGEAEAALTARQAELKKALVEANRNVNEATKSHKALNDEASKGALDEAIDEQVRLRQELKDTEQALKLNSKTFEELYQNALSAAKGIRQAEKSSQSAARGMKEDAQDMEHSMSGKLSSLAKGLARSGVIDEFASSVSGLAGAALTSYIGEPTAQLVSQTVRGALSGAAAGVIFGPTGALIGGAFGAASGAISGGTTIAQAQDDSFKSIVQENVEGQLSEMDAIRASGSAIAAQREKDAISFTTLFGDRSTAQNYLTNLNHMANTTPFLYDDLTAMSKTLASYGYKADSILPVLQTVGDTGAALGMSTSDMNAIATALGRMQTSGKTTLEYLNILNDRGVNAVEILSSAHGVDQGTTYKMISDGKLNGQESVQYILDALKERFSGSMLEQSRTFEGRTSTVQGLEQEMDYAMGVGYNQTRTKGLAEQIEWLQGDSLLSIQGAYSMIGQWQASLENTKEQLEREALDTVMTGNLSESYADSAQRERLSQLAEEYKKAMADYENGHQEAGATMGRLLAEARIIAANEYNASEGAQLLLESEKTLIQSVREDTVLNDLYWDAGYSLGQEFSKGRAAAMDLDLDLGERMTQTSFEEEGSYRNPDSDNYSPIMAALQDESEEGDVSGIVNPRKKPSGGIVQWESGFAPYFLNSSAAGIRRVPYDGYPALLHEDERVLTARETRTLDILPAFPSFSRNSASETPAPAAEPVTVTVNVSGNTFGGDMNPEDIASAIAEQAAAQLAEALTRKRLAGWR